MPLTRAWKRRLTLALWILGLPMAWKGTLRIGPSIPPLWAATKDSLGMPAGHPGPGPALFRPHASWVIQAELGFPRKLQGYIPAPEPGSPAHQQLMGLGLWSGSQWTPQALALGDAEGRGLRPRLGRLALARVEGVSPSRDYNGPELCQVDYWVTWEVDEPARDLVRTARLVNLRLPEGLSVETPGAGMDQQITLERTWMGWRVWRPDSLAIPGRPSRGRAWLTFLL